MGQLNRTNVGNIISRCAELASLLEVSAYPKPGNVHRLRDFPETRYEHFLAGSIAIGPVIRELAQKGYDIKNKDIKFDEIRIGDFILNAVNEVMKWQKGGNVNLGIILLFSPITIAAGYTLKDQVVPPKKLRKKVTEVVNLTSPADTISVFKAIRLSMPDKVLGNVRDLDVKNNSSYSQILEEKISLKDVFTKCADYDSICREWITNFEITFSEGYRYLKKRLFEIKDINFSIVDTFLFILSKHVDSLIERKSGYNKALKVSKEAEKILNSGGSSSKKGLKMLRNLDKNLHKASGRLNPGTTADLTANSIYILLLEGWRP